MTGKIPTTSPSNQQASPTESLSKQAKGEAKGKQILVLDEGGKFEVTSRKTGVGTSIKRLAVRVAVLFTSKDKSYWNKALGLDQDNRATRAAVAFTEKFNAEADSSVKVKKTYVAIDQPRLSEYIDKYNEVYPNLFIDRELDGALDEMGVPKDDEIRQKAKDIATVIVEYSKIDPSGQLLSKEDVVARLKFYRTLLEGGKDNEYGFNVHREELSTNMADWLQNGMAHQNPLMNEPLSLPFKHIIDLIDKSNHEHSAKQFCLLQATAALSESTDGVAIATGFVEFMEGKENSRGGVTYSSARGFLSEPNNRNYMTAGSILYEASCAVLGKEPTQYTIL